MESAVAAVNGQRCVESYDVGFRRYLLQAGEAAAFLALARRVAWHHTHAQPLAPARHDAADVPHAYHAQCQVLRGLSVQEFAYCRKHILRHCGALHPGALYTAMPFSRQYPGSIWSVPIVAVAMNLTRLPESAGCRTGCVS